MVKIIVEHIVSQRASVLNDETKKREDCFYVDFCDYGEFYFKDQDTANRIVRALKTAYKKGKRDAKKELSQWLADSF